MSATDGVGGGVHAAAATGYQRASGVYTRGRPSYPPATVGRLAQRFATVTVLDVGAGSGAMTALLAERGVAVTAVEPVDAMVRRVPAGRRVRARADALPVRNGAAGGIVVATAFHWFATPAVLAEFHRVLARTGVLALVWNVRDETVPWVRAHTAIVDPHAGGVPRYASMRWREVLDDSQLFTTLDDHVEPNPSPTDRDGLVARVLSTSFIAALDDGARAAVEAEARELADTLPASFDYPYLTRTVLLGRR